MVVAMIGGITLRPVIGILAYRKGSTFQNSKFLCDLVREGNNLGAQVYAFSYLDLLEKERKIIGFVPDRGGKWHRETFPWPDVVIDFCRMLRKPFRDMRRRKDLFVYANHKFTYKWKAMKLFSESDEVKKWIPETLIYSPSNLNEMLKKHAIVYVKPGNGTGGRSVVKIKRLADKYVMQGRRRSGHIVRLSLNSSDSVINCLNRWVRAEQIRSGKFIVQQGLDLELLPGRVMDARILIQKDGDGKWKITGKALKVGGKHSPTTNLIYRDGQVLRFRDFIPRRFGVQKAEQIDKECDQLALRLMEVIERKFGLMIEFGLDVGIDTKGKVWLIEANPKPGHSAFMKTKEYDIYRKSLRRPIQYALSVIRTGAAEASD
jgi:hypothetical protein